MAITKILIVDDEQDILDILKQFLTKQGYTITTCKDGSEVINIAKKILPDIFILDVMMPKKNGFELCEMIRYIDVLKNKYIFLLTALHDENNHIKGLEKGADDYLFKPISLKILKTKIEKVISKIQQHQTKEVQNNRLTFGDIEIDINTYAVKVGGTEIQLARKEFELLHLLASHTDKIFQRSNILNQIWGEDIIVTERTIDVHVRKIRKKLNRDCIKTQKGIGYKFEYQL